MWVTVSSRSPCSTPEMSSTTRTFCSNVLSAVADPMTGPASRGPGQLLGILEPRQVLQEVDGDVDMLGALVDEEAVGAPVSAPRRLVSAGAGSLMKSQLAASSAGAPPASVDLELDRLDVVHATSC
jgi:hypothetical protein